MGLRIIRGVCPTDPSSGDTKIQMHIPPDREFIFGIRDVHLQWTWSIRILPLYLERARGRALVCPTLNESEGICSRSIGVPSN